MMNYLVLKKMIINIDANVDDNNGYHKIFKPVRCKRFKQFLIHIDFVCNYTNFINLTID